MMKKDSINRNILLFSKYFGYNVGGAERSVMEILKENEAEGARIKILFVENVKSFNSQCLKVQFPLSWEVEPIRLCCDGVHFRYWSYIANRNRIHSALARQDPTWCLYTYGIFAPAALCGFSGSSVYLIRDEGGLGRDVTYYHGWRRLLRDAYALAQHPARQQWREDLERGLSQAEILVNSRYIAEEANKQWPGANIEVRYPAINTAELQGSFQNTQKIAPERRGIVLVGDQQVKGSDIFRHIAARLPHRLFLIFDRSHHGERQEGNILFMPWQADSGAIYRYARIVLLPSRWDEAYSRVGREAVMLGIPVLGSRRGGIPEALEDAPERLIDDAEDVDEWCRRIEEILGVF